MGRIHSRIETHLVRLGGHQWWMAFPWKFGECSNRFISRSCMSAIQITVADSFSQLLNLAMRSRKHALLKLTRHLRQSSDIECWRRLGRWQASLRRYQGFSFLQLDIAWGKVVATKARLLTSIYAIQQVDTSNWLTYALSRYVSWANQFKLQPWAIIVQKLGNHFVPSS